MSIQPHPYCGGWFECIFTTVFHVMGSGITSYTGFMLTPSGGLQEGQLAGVVEGDVAGRAQAVLAAFLSRCPQGLVLIDGDALSRHPAAVGPLINALSERGSFFRDGASLPTSGALYIMVIAVSAETLADGQTEEMLTSGVKAQLVALLSGGAGSGLKGGLENVFVRNADALRRRFEIVARLARES